MQTTARRAASTDGLKLRALAYRALGALLSGEPPYDAAQLDELVACFDLLAWRNAAEAARRSSVALIAAPEAARTQHSRIFHRSLPPPYETTYTSGGSVSDLADIAGFYRAFGMAVEGEKADHVTAELEFLSYLLVKELHAIDQREPEQAAICREARATFLASHGGTWLPLFADQIEKVSPGDAYVDLVRAAHFAITADAGEQGIALPEPVAYATRFASIPGPAVSPDRPYCDGGEDDEPEGQYG